MCKIGSDEGRLWLPVLCISFFGLVGKRGVFEGFSLWFLGTDVLLRSIIPFAPVVCYAMDFV